MYSQGGTNLTVPFPACSPCPSGYNTSSTGATSKQACSGAFVCARAAHERCLRIHISTQQTGRRQLPAHTNDTPHLMPLTVCASGMKKFGALCGESKWEWPGCACHATEEAMNRQGGMGHTMVYSLLFTGATLRAGCWGLTMPPLLRQHSTLHLQVF